MDKNSNKLKLPKGLNEDQERDFWMRINLADYFDKKDLRPVSFPKLKPTSRLISIRIPEHLLLRLKEQANILGIPYQSMIKKYIAEGIIKKDDKILMSIEPSSRGTEDKGDHLSVVRRDLPVISSVGAGDEFDYINCSPVSIYTSVGQRE